MSTPITDMSGFQVKSGDTIAASFRSYNGSYPELRLGTILMITNRKHTGRGSGGKLRPALLVQWFSSSNNEAVNECIREDNEFRVAQDLPPKLHHSTYIKKETYIYPEHKRFLKIS